MNISPNDFWELSLSELQIKSEGYFLRIEREWEHTRLIASYMHTQAEGKVITPEKLMPLTFDEENPSIIKSKEKSKPLTKQDVKDFEEKWLKPNKD